MNKHSICLFFILAILWLFNSGLYSPLLLVLGLLSIFFVIWLSLRMGIIDDESQPIHLSRKLPAFYWWLIKKVIQSNIDVIVHICRGNASISPCVAVLPVSQHSEIAKVIYANSISLTPGTVAMSLQHDSVYIHSLTRAGMEELQGGEMAHRVNQLEI
jgi:multicomponent Na+:H+ antiporter subunit E